jgi:hypothetical protein
MMCICCDEKISLYLTDKNEEDVVFNKEKRGIHGEPEEEIILDAGSQMWKDGVVDLISAGYGSIHDGDEFIIAICDECLNKKIMTGHIAYIDNYVGESIKGSEKYKSARIAWRRYNRINDILS